MENKTFLMAFQITKLIIFEVDYYFLGSNERPYFATRCNKYVRSKRDISQDGQAQESLLPHTSTAYRFYKRWNEYHCKDIPADKYDELIRDIDKLKQVYNYIEVWQDENHQPQHLPRYDVIEMSKLKPKTR